jgi:hypothetical protein
MPIRNQPGLCALDVRDRSDLRSTQGRPSPTALPFGHWHYDWVTVSAAQRIEDIDELACQAVRELKRGPGRALGDNSEHVSKGQLTILAKHVQTLRGTRGLERFRTRCKSSWVRQNCVELSHVR